ncbi:glycosyltransferase involved in cell wall biosynthesis [Maribacter caenipelagi]|uniref:Glycosyltransferase involved in cell wall biosynthesis n=1 Tax=Maribacter caenipelagi TaxID=1447781 RepID=A0A4V3E302_9FLAO|nr:glycosyltransferase [Maribacter caenipelagi]TDS18648.1 glycosyltransferase involved in cell wall biosynthesis [Maribacter caenipelagi]
MKNNQISISIIVPVYNVESYLEKCFNSVLSQKFTKWEMIVVNDCSPDNSQNIIDEYALKDSRIISIINEQNKGLGGARNIGLKYCKGQYIMFLDSDDFISDNSVLEQLYSQGLAYDLDVLDSRYNMLENDSVKAILPNKFKMLNEKSYTGKEYLDLVSIMPIVAWNKLYKRTFIEKHNITFKERKYEDICFTLECLFKANKIQNTEVIFYNYIVRPGSIMTSKPNKSSIEDAWSLCKDLESLYLNLNRNSQIEKSFFYSFVSISKLLSGYDNEEHKSEIISKLKRIHRKYRLQILSANKLGVKQKILLYLSPQLMSFVLNKVK